MFTLSKKCLLALADNLAGKLPCWQTALLAKIMLQKSLSALDAVKSRTHLPLAEFKLARGTPHQCVLAPQKMKQGIQLNFK